MYLSYVCTRSFDPQYVTPSVIFTSISISLDLSAYKCAHTLVLTACINICTPFLSSLSCVHTFVNLSVCDSDCVHYNVVLLTCTVHISVRFPCHIFAICSTTIINLIGTEQFVYMWLQYKSNHRYAYTPSCTSNRNIKFNVPITTSILHVAPQKLDSIDCTAAMPATRRRKHF